MSTSVYLVEAGHTSPPPARIDRERSVIHDVRVLRWESAQGHGYSLRAGMEALRLRLYEGKPVHYQHATPGQRRSVYDVMGMIRSPKLKADGIYADLHYLKSHPKAGELLEAATNPQTGVGPSHVARGTKATHAGRDVIVSIDEVHAVDFCHKHAHEQDPLRLLASYKTVVNLKRSLDRAEADPDKAFAASRDAPADVTAATVAGDDPTPYEARYRQTELDFENFSRRYNTLGPLFVKADKEVRQVLERALSVERKRMHADGHARFYAARQAATAALVPLLPAITRAGAYGEALFPNPHLKAAGETVDLVATLADFRYDDPELPAIE